jgi:hypothetical protein
MRVLRCLLLVMLVSTTGTYLLAEDQCSKSSLNGAFGFAGMGLIPQRTQNGGLRYDPVPHVGMTTYDGRGTVTVSVCWSSIPRKNVSVQLLRYL